MIKNDLVNALSEMDYCKNQASIVINDIFKVIAEALVERTSGTGCPYKAAKNDG